MKTSHALKVCLFFISLFLMANCGSSESDAGATVQKAWVFPASLTDDISPDNQNVSSVKVASSDNGDIVVVWYQSNGTHNQIFKSEYRNGTWTHPSSLADNISPDNQSAFSPSVAMDDEGNTIVTWYQSDGTSVQVFKSEYRSGAWVHPTDLNDNISPASVVTIAPVVAMDQNGNALIAWVQRDGATDEQVFKSEYRSGAWTHPSGLADNISPDGTDSYYPEVAMDNNGNAIITWIQYDTVSGFDRIIKSEYRSGAWSHPADFSGALSLVGQHAEDVVVQMDDSNNAVIAWIQNDGSRKQVFKSDYRSSAWSNPATLADNISPDGQNVSSLRMAINSAGVVVIVWAQSNGTEGQIFKSEYRNGTWTHPSSLADNITVDGRAASSPAVFVDLNGSAVISYAQNTTSGVHIFKSEYRSGAWTHNSSLDNFFSVAGGISANAPDVSMNAEGNSIIVWTQNTGSHAQVFKAEYR